MRLNFFRILGTTLFLGAATTAWAQTSTPAANLVEEETVGELRAEAKADQEQLSTRRKYKGELKLTLSGRRFEDDAVNSRFARTAIGLKMEGRHSDWLQGHLGFTQMNTSGAASTLYEVAEGSANTNGLYLDEASLTLSPTAWVEATAGVSNYSTNPLLSTMFPQSWAGGFLTLQQEGDDGSVHLTAAQAIPSSLAISNRLLDEDTLPLYTAATLDGDIKLIQGWKVGAAATSFIFTDPSSQAAKDAQKIGNDVSGNGKSYLFAYNFRGTEVAGEISKTFDRGDKLTLKGASLNNTEAPSEQAKATQTRLEYERPYDKVKLIGSIGRFSIGANSLPAGYTSSSLGYTNRFGDTATFKVEFPKEKFQVFVGYTKANVLDPAALAAQFQADREIYSLGAELKHDLF